MNITKPTVSRTVHYTSYGSPGGEFMPACRAAIITEVDDPDNPASAVGLCVLNPTGIYFNQHVPYEQPDDGPEGHARGGTWHWPERV